jgi:endonuclease-3
MPNPDKIAKLLLKKYPDPRIELNFSSPLELLIATILAARCTDAKVNEVTKSLFKKYRSAKDYAEADPERLENDIRQITFYKNKARLIIKCCKKLVEEYKGKVPDSIEALTTLPGVGRKTANMVLGSAFGRQTTMAVDTHVLRVSNRLGLVNSDDPDEVEKRLIEQFPQNRLTKLNLALILHGRYTCTASRPKCGECVLFDECQWEGKRSH